MATNLQTIRVSLAGDVITLRKNKGAGFDPRKLEGIVDVQRVSSIEWAPHLNGFKITILQGDYKGEVLTVDLLHAAGLCYSDIYEKFMRGVHSYNGIITFDDYEDAVETEIMFLEKTSLAGIG